MTAGKSIGAWLDQDDDEKWKAWGSDFSTVIELMEGKKDKVLEESADWREAVGAWGILVDVGLRRDDLSSVSQSPNSVVGMV